MGWSALPQPLGVAMGDTESGHAIAVDGGAGGSASFLVIHDDTGAVGEYGAGSLTFDLGGGEQDAGDPPAEGAGTDDAGNPPADAPATAG